MSLTWRRRKDDVVIADGLKATYDVRQLLNGNWIVFRSVGKIIKSHHTGTKAECKAWAETQETGVQTRHDRPKTQRPLYTDDPVERANFMVQEYASFGRQVSIGEALQWVSGWKSPETIAPAKKPVTVVKETGETEVLAVRPKGVDKWGYRIGTRSANVNAVLTTTPKFETEIRQAIGYPKPVHSHLSTLVRKGLAIRTKDGKYALAQ